MFTLNSCNHNCHPSLISRLKIKRKLHDRSLTSMSNSNLDESLSNELAAPFLVWSHLTHNCHDKAALAFLKQWQGLDDSNVQTKKKGKKGMNSNNELANELLNSPAWLTLEYRKCTNILINLLASSLPPFFFLDLRVLIEDGRMADAIEYLRQYFPHIYDNQCILFRLHCQHFIELVRSDRYDLALDYVSRVLTPAVSKDTVLLDPLLGDVAQLLAYKDPHTSPVAHLLSQERRNSLSDDINAAILSN